jgi:ribosome-binding protein aMBF1 (putative translation factor)
MQKKPIEKQGDLKIRGDVLRSARENMGLDRDELAEVVCLKPWHITQMEDTEEHYFFYSQQLKIKAAKKIGEYLALEESSYLY